MAMLLSNENFPLPAVLGLRARGHDVLTIQDTGRAGEAMPGDEVLGYATAQGRAVLTLNRKDFIRLHMASMNHTGIVVYTLAPAFFGQAERIHEALQCERDLRGKLLRVNRPGP